MAILAMALLTMATYHGYTCYGCTLLWLLLLWRRTMAILAMAVPTMATLTMATYHGARHLDVGELVGVGVGGRGHLPAAHAAGEQQGARELRRVLHAHAHGAGPRSAAMHDRGQPVVGRVDPVAQRAQREDEVLCGEARLVWPRG